uniref:DUF1794 domain-containing protein n=1 Tax=Syphacia muris TaxID=451379 RepID=A0A0N5AJT5_9BILA
MYHPAGARQKDVSTRLIKPTLPDINVDNVLGLVANWNLEWEVDGEISIYDEGIAQYMLTDRISHEKFYAALILRKPSLRCRLSKEEPNDILDKEEDNCFTLVSFMNLT